MQWHNGRQWHQQSNGTNNMAPQSTPQHFGMNPMGLGMYPNVMPYPVMPSIQSQVSHSPSKVFNQHDCSSIGMTVIDAHVPVASCVCTPVTASCGA